MSEKTINEQASKLSKSYKIATRIKELKKVIESKTLYTIEQSINRDIKMIERYEGALFTIVDENATERQKETAKELIKSIPASVYNSAQDRLSKQLGFYEKDNEQTNQTITLPVINIGAKVIK